MGPKKTTKGFLIGLQYYIFVPEISTADNVFMQKITFLPYRHLNIKNIIFDLGGVILNIDYHLTIDAFKKLGFENFDEIFTQAKQMGIFDQLDKGLVTPDKFRDGVRELSGKPFTNQQIDEAWNAMLLNFPVHRLELIEKIHTQYRTFLLSNTNQIHYEVYNNDLYNVYGVRDLSHFFEKVYYSHQIHMRKPDREAFQIILDENNLNAEETLFIDDTEQHIVGAKVLGINTYHLNLKEGEAIERLFIED
ncbi:MAG: HAD family phosphatase [Bacteroidales bacterium]|nr:MAG: HAD family phosphatase [Bacteroidales bacterium]